MRTIDYSPNRKQTLKEQGFYKTSLWRCKRKKILIRDHYLCQLRISKECTRIATEVHHVKELEDYPELALDDNNLTSCCWNCHELTKQRSAHKKALNDASAKGVRIIKFDDSGKKLPK